MISATVMRSCGLAAKMRVMRSIAPGENVADRACAAQNASYWRDAHARNHQSWRVAVWNGGKPASMMNSTTPADQTSAGSPSYGKHDSTSGLMYDRVPHCVYSSAIAPSAPSRSPESPKSAILSPKCSSSNRFSGLMSRWYTPFV